MTLTSDIHAGFDRNRGSPIRSTRPVVCISHGFQSNYERGFCSAVARAGVDVTLVGSDTTDAAALPEELEFVNMRKSQDPHRSDWSKAFNLIRYHIALMGFVAGRRQSIVHVIGLVWPVIWCGVIQGMWFRLVCHRYVLTVHDVVPHDRHDPLTNFACRVAYRWPNRLIVHTDRMRLRLEAEMGVAPRRIVVMEHGIEPRRESPARSRSCDTERVPMLLAFGGVARRKGTDVLLKALGSVSFEFRLVIAGGCVDDGYRELLRHLIDSHSKRTWITWQDGFVPEVEMERLFGDAAVTVLPYRYIDQSGVLFQALRFGVPVVATRVGQFERYVSEEVGVLCDAESVASLADALDRWFRQRTEFSPDAIRRVGDRFDWAVTVRALDGVYA